MTTETAEIPVVPQEKHAENTTTFSAIRDLAREYLGTFATEFTVLASQLLAYKLAAHFLGKTGFSEYAVARRTISLIYPLPLLGLAVALPRYVARTLGPESDTRAARYFGAAVWCIAIALLVSTLLINAFPGTFALLFFAGRQYANLILPLSLLLTGLVLHSLVYSYSRGRLEMKRANVLQLINLGFVPLAAFVIFSDSVRSVLLAMGILTTAVSLVGLLLSPVKSVRLNVKPEAKELLRYGVQRVPGDFVLMALLTLPVTFVAHFSGIQQAGYVAFGISVVNMIGSMFQPLGLILLPKASRMLAGGAHAELRTHVAQIVKATALVSIFASIVLEISAAGLIKLYLGPSFSDAVVILRIMLLAALPFSLYCVLRNVIDAYHENAVNALNLSISFAAFLVIASISLVVVRSPYQILWAFVLSALLLAVLCRAETARILAERAM